MTAAELFERAVAIGIDPARALAVAETLKPLAPAPDRPCTDNTPLSILIDGEPYTLTTKGHNHIISDSVGPLCAYLDQTAAELDFAAMVRRGDARRARA